MKARQLLEAENKRLREENPSMGEYLDVCKQVKLYEGILREIKGWVLIGEQENDCKCIPIGDILNRTELTPSREAELEESCYYYEGIIEDVRELVNKPGQFYKNDIHAIRIALDHPKPTVTKGELVEALEDYAKHPNCAAWCNEISDPECNCGFKKVSDLIARAKGEG
jgi:hypothetical protein